MAHYHHAPQKFDRSFKITTILQLGYVLLQVVMGILAHSVSLLTDAAHNLSDSGVVLLAWWADSQKTSKPTLRKTYGKRGMTLQSAVFSATALLVISLLGAAYSVYRLRHLNSVSGETMGWVALLGIPVNAVSAAFFLRGSKEDLNIRSAFQHLKTDAIMSLGVSFAGFVIHFTNWRFLDPLVGLVISLVICKVAWDLLVQASHEATGGVPESIDLGEILSWFRSQPEVVEVHDLHARATSTDEQELTAHVVLKKGLHASQFLQKSHTALHEFGLERSTIQIEEEGADCPHRGLLYGVVGGSSSEEDDLERHAHNH